MLIKGNILNIVNYHLNPSHQSSSEDFSYETGVLTLVGLRNVTYSNLKKKML